MSLYREFGFATVQNRLTYDTHPSGDSLRKQLEYESTKGIGPNEFDQLLPYRPKSNETVEDITQPPAHDDPAHIATVWLSTTMVGGTQVGQIKYGYDDWGLLRSLEARGSYGMPPGWAAEDKLTVNGSVRDLESTFTGPNGERGTVVRTFNGKTLVLDQAYRSSLPAKLSGVPGLQREVPTMNYMTARALSILAVDSDNLKEIRGSLVQHQLTVGHLDWLSRKYPEASLGTLIYHTSWAKNIDSTAHIVGHQLANGASVVLQGSSQWNAENPGAKVRGWDHPQEVASSLAVTHVTGARMAPVDAPGRDWRAENQAALEQHFSQLRATHGEVEGTRLSDKTKTLLAKIDGEQARIERRYGIDHEKGPAHMNFDVTFQTRRA